MENDNTARSIYIDHYTRLRAACFGTMLHGINFDRENAERLCEKYDVRRGVIKEEILKITDGFKLWSEKVHRSKEMVEALDEQRRSRETLKRRRADLRSAGVKGKALTSEVLAERARVEAAQSRVAEIKSGGRDREVEVGSGLSDDKIAEWFYGKCGIAPIMKLRKPKKEKTVTVDDIALKKIRQQNGDFAPLVDLIREHRKCTKLISTYLDPAKLDNDGRLRCMYKTYGTNSGRLASAANPEGTGMNLQNFDMGLKPLLVPDEGE